MAAPLAEVAATVVDLEHYPEWWPQVRAVAKLGPDTAWVRCRSALPYTLDLVLDAVTRTPPVLEVAISGDLAGFARFALEPTAGGTRLEFRQEVEARGRLALASYVARPLLTWNHGRMMAGCRGGLAQRALAR
jgi:carbon monoxide dehydrogenase subunit G